MKKIFSILLVLLLMFSMTGCITDLAQDEWQVCSINEQEFAVVANSEQGYTVKPTSSSDILFDFFKDGEKVCSNAGFVANISKENIEDMSNVGKILKERKEDGITYSLYENISEDSAVTYFVIAFIEEKNAIFTFETNGNLEEIKDLFDNFKVS